MSKSFYVFAFFWLLIMSVLLGGCASSQINAAAAPTHLNRAAPWAVLPLDNNTASPYAGERVQSQLAALLRSKDMRNVLIAPRHSQSGPLPIDNDAHAQRQFIKWARKHQARYALTGSVNEWRYKIGLDGQPVVGFALELIDLKQNRTIWSGVASASGDSREGLAVLSQKVLDEMLDRLLR